MSEQAQDTVALCFKGDVLKTSVPPRDWGRPLRNSGTKMGSDAKLIVLRIHISCLCEFASTILVRFYQIPQISIHIFKHSNNTIWLCWLLGTSVRKNRSRCCHRIWWRNRSMPANVFSAGCLFSRRPRWGLHLLDPPAPACFSLAHAASCQWHGDASSLPSRSSCNVWRQWQRGREHLPPGPSSGGSSRCHGWGTLSITWRNQLPTSRSWV